MLLAKKSPAQGTLNKDECWDVRRIHSQEDGEGTVIGLQGMIIRVSAFGEQERKAATHAEMSRPLVLHFFACNQGKEAKNTGQSNECARDRDVYL